MILALQLVITPMLQASTVQSYTPSEKGDRVVQVDVVIESQSGSYSDENHDKCDGINGTVDRCTSCFCISAALFSQEFQVEGFSNQALLAKVPKSNLYHIYLFPPFRPPIL